MTLLLLLACNKGDQTFTNTDGNVDNVMGNGALELSASEVVIPDCEVGTSKGGLLTIKSVGEQNLVVHEARVVSSGGGVFISEEIEDRTIAPGSSLDVAITATLKEAKPTSGQLRLKTNDPNYIDAMLTLRATPTGWTEDTGGTDSGGTDSGGTDSGTDSGT